MQISFRSTQQGGEECQKREEAGWGEVEEEKEKRDREEVGKGKASSK